MVRAIYAKGKTMTEKQTHTPGPWKPCRSHEMFDGPMYDIEPDEAADYEAKPYVRIVAAGDEYVAAAHDLLASLRRIIDVGTDRNLGSWFTDNNGWKPSLSVSIYEQAQRAVAKAAGGE